MKIGLGEIVSLASQLQANKSQLKYLVDLSDSNAHVIWNYYQKSFFKILQL